MEYTSFRYIYPPRPELFGMRVFESFKNDSNWIAQLKLNGSRTLIVIQPDNDIVFWTRHKTMHKAYSPTPEMRASLLLLHRPVGWLVLDGELLHNKSPLIKDTLVLYDVLVYESKYLFGTSYGKRLRLLKWLTGWSKDVPMAKDNLAWEISKHVWLSRSYRKNFKKLFERVTKHELVEGLVMKDTDAPLGYHFNSDKCSWMGKIRKPAANYLV